MNSIGTLYIDCPEQEKQGAFEAGKNITEDEYVRMLREYSATIGVGIPKNTQNNRHYNVYNYDDYKENEELTYTKASSKIYNISGQPCDVKELQRIQKTGMGVIIFEIIESSMEESSESEFKFWKKDSMNINNDKDIDKNERIKFLPTKDLKFEIDRHMFCLSGCKIYCEYDKLKVAIIIQNVKEI